MLENDGLKDGYWNKFDNFGWKVGIYHRLFALSLPLAAILIFGFELVGIGLSVFFIGIPLFWNLRSRELLKQQRMIEDYFNSQKTGNPSVGYSAWARNFYTNNPTNRNPWANSEEE